MKKLLLFALLVCIKQVNAQTYVAIPDSNFVHYLKGIIPTAFKGDSLNTSSTLVTTTTQSISVNGNGISNLSGVQYFTSLTHLWCINNSLTSLPILANSIVNLNCDSNQLTSLPALPTSLQTLSCMYNNLTNLPSLPSSLQALQCNNNSLTSLPSLPSGLYFFNCNNNSITSLPAFLPTGLIYFWVAYNQLTSLPNLPNSIQYFGCYYNGITSIPNLPTSLKYFYCYNNYLTNLPTLPASLLYLECEDNDLTSLPPLPTNLQILYCDHNNITCFPTFPSSIVSPYFNIANNPFTCLPNYIFAMGSDTVIYPLCAAGNTHGCPVVATGIEQFANSNEQVNIYPNPTTSSFVIEPNNKTKQTMQVYDVTGKMVLSQTINGKTNIDANSLNEGAYNISLQSNEGVVNKRLVIVR